MLVLLLSDVHGNAEALRAVLAAAGPVDAVWNLGDNVGYGASPNEVLDLLRPLSTHLVRGNHDRVCSGLSPVSLFNPSARAAAEWTQQALTQDHLQWLRALPTGPVSPVPNLALTHGSPRHEDHYVLDLQDAADTLREMSTPLTFFGHSHLQGVFELSSGHASAVAPIVRGSSLAESRTLVLEPGSRYLINPGSVGQPRDRDWRAAFALFDPDARTIAFHRIPYDVEQAQQRILAAGLPTRLAHRLAEGA
jgi:predicted phosphodiesterase